MNNYIIAEIYIKEEEIYDNIRIINSFENMKREKKMIREKFYYKYENEKEIKENTTMEIDNKNMKFKYYCYFKKVGKHEIKYIFK